MNVIILMGVSGAGKTTVGRRLARRLRWSFQEGDSFHAIESIEQMARGAPLTDRDRQPWLNRVRAFLRTSLAQGDHVVLACSALKKAYRKRLRVSPAVTFVYLCGTRALLQQRLRARRGHYMKPRMLSSQLADLEEPSQREALRINAALSAGVIVTRIVKELRP